MTEPAYTTSGRTKYVIVATAVILGFFTAYGYAVSRNSPATPTSAPTQCAGSGTGADCSGSSSGTGAGAAAATGECGGCGTTPQNAPEGATAFEGDVQRVAVDVSQGYFDPTVIRASAGVPIELVFSQGSGCLAEVVFSDFGVREDLTQGGAVVTLPALEAGEYGFSCGMDMVFGSIVVE